MASHSLFLEHDVGVGFQIGHVNLLSVLDDFRVLARHQPAAVAEEESSVGVVRIGVCVRVFVMLAMVSHPHIQAILQNGNPFSAFTHERAVNAPLTCPASVCSHNRKTLSGAFALKAR